MKYYKVTNESDMTTSGKLEGLFVNRALYTEKELTRKIGSIKNLSKSVQVYNPRKGKHEIVKISRLLQSVNINKNKTEFFFGYRWER